MHTHINGCYKYHISQDLREFKAVRKVDGVLLNLTVFREVMYLCISISMSVCVCMIVEVVLTLLIQTLLQGSGVYIDAYDAETSNTYMLTLAAEDIPALLVRALSLVHISICMHTYCRFRAFERSLLAFPSYIR